MSRGTAITFFNLQYTEMLRNDEEIFNEKARQLSDLKKENAQMVSAECTVLYFNFSLSKIGLTILQECVMRMSDIRKLRNVTLLEPGVFAS